MIDLKLLVQSGVQFGHQTWRWCPKMAPYIWGKKNGIHLIDVSKTAFQLEKAANFLEQLATEGKQILWVGSKPRVEKEASLCLRYTQMGPFCHHIFYHAGAKKGAWFDVKKGGSRRTISTTAESLLNSRSRKRLTSPRFQPCGCENGR